MLQSAEEQLDEQLHVLDKLEKSEDDMERLRRSRLDQLKKMQNQKAEWIAAGHGEYRECDDQKRFFDDLRNSPRAVVHFYRPTTRRCEIVDKHLGLLARKHLETKFVRVNAERCPFLCERLNIWMLPTIVLIVNNIDTSTRSTDDGPSLNSRQSGREREQRPLTRITVTQPRAAHTSSSTCTPFNQRARVPRLPRPVLARGSHRQSNCCSAALRGQRSSLYRSLFASSPMSPGLAVGGLATPSDAHSKGMQSARTRRAWGYSFPPRPQGHSLNRRRRAD
jgi:hypothetical protein